MNEIMQKYMSVGLISFMAFPQSVKDSEEALRRIRQIACDEYFDSIEISHIENVQIRKQVTRELEQAHIRVGYCASPALMQRGLSLNALEKESRQKAVELMYQEIDEANEHGAVGISFLSGNYEEEHKEEAFEALVNSIQRICDYTKGNRKLQLLLEIFDYDVDKCALIGPTSLALRLGKIMKNYDSFGLMVDLSHIPLLHETIEQAVLPLAPYIRHAHMGNAVLKSGALAYGDLHPRFGFPNSENDVEELTLYLRALLKIGYLNDRKPGTVSFEIKPFGDENSELIIAGAKRTLNMAWARV